MLKWGYGRRIETFIKALISHILKVDFFLAFTAAYTNSNIVLNCRAGFRGASLLPFELQVVLSKLDVKLRTLTPSRVPLADVDFWVSQTPANQIKALG